MKKLSITLVGAACAIALGAAATFAWQLPARAQVRVTPALQPVGAAAGATTTAWFQDAASGRVVACHSSVSGGTVSVACGAAALP